jgi:hypothetical protein
MATTDVMWETQKAIYTVLSGDSTMQSLVTGVYDKVPQPKLFPYVALGEGTAKFNDSFGIGSNTQQWDMTLTIHVWGQEDGFDDVLAITRQIYTLLHKKESSLILNGFTADGCWQEFQMTLRDIDGRTRHVVLRYRLIIEEN